jgi:hypothetical protein
MNFAKNELILSSITRLILKENKQFIRVAEKNGLALAKESMFHDQLHQVYRIQL